LRGIVGGVSGNRLIVVCGVFLLNLKKKTIKYLENEIIDIFFGKTITNKKGMSKSKSKQNGGRRVGSGRKKIDDKLKKKPITLYLAEIDMDKVGGESKFRELCYGLVNVPNPIK